MKKTIRIFTFLTFLISLCAMLTASVTALTWAGEYKEFGECHAELIKSVSDMEGIPAGYTEEITVSYADRGGTASYFKFTLDTDSWVCLAGGYSMYSHDGAGTHVDIYYDKAMGNKAGSYGWGYWQYSREFTGFLKKGTYYAAAVTKQENFQGAFTGNINIIAAAIPVSAVFDFDVRAASSRKSAAVFFADALGPYARNVQFRRGSVGLENAGSRKYWKKRLMDDYYSSSPSDAVLLLADGGAYSFKAETNGYYTAMVEDISGSRYSSVAEVSCIDDKKPEVFGVKDGKTYRKAVIIRFSDCQSGIKSAKLNGKKIHSGKKVSAAGAYKLAVTDKAGNRIVVKFCIKR